VLCRTFSKQWMASRSEGQSSRCVGKGQLSFWAADGGLYYGLYFQTPEGEDAFYFGVWGLYWELHGFPLWFGVKEKWGTAVKKAFHDAYKWDTRRAKFGYTLGWVDKRCWMDQTWSAKSGRSLSRLSKPLWPRGARYPVVQRYEINRLATTFSNGQVDLCRSAYQPGLTTTSLGIQASN
jgi:hypothetical protein